MSQELPPSTPSATEPTAPAGPPHHRTIVAGIHWSSAFEFSYLFRGFRMAMNPTKLLIALLAIAAIYTAGRLFDVVWGPRVYVGEIKSFQEDNWAAYGRHRDTIREDQRADLREKLLNFSTSPNFDGNQIDKLSEDPRQAQRILRREYIERFHQDIANETPEQRTADAAILEGSIRSLHDTVGHGIFDSLMTYEISQFDALIENTLTFVRISPIDGPGATDSGRSQAISGGLFSKDPKRLWRSDTILGCLANMTVTAPYWLAVGTEPMQWHPAPEDTGTWKGWSEVWLLHRLPYLLSLFVLLAFWLLVIACSGAMICRISALEFAGQPEAPLPKIWKFARAKLSAFFVAPLMPLMIIVALGGALTFCGLMGAIPYLGEIFIGVFFFGFLAGAFVMMLVVLGVIGGFNLMYPTISVEGSDAFDACSRSWAYVYGAPWRLILYSVIALVYGIITLLFVSFAAYLVLGLTHTFVGFGTNFFGSAHGHYNGLDKIDTLWPMPKINELSPPINWWAMNWSEWIGSVFLHCWVYTVITMVGAYVMSFHYSIHTILYFLLRRAVEGQSLNEVYQEEEPATNN